MIDAIVMQIGLTASSPRCDPFGENAQHRIEIMPIQRAIGIGEPYHVQKLRLSPLLRRHCRNDLLREDVERSGRYFDTIKVSSSRRSNQSRTLDQLVSCR